MKKPADCSTGFIVLEVKEDQFLALSTSLFLAIPRARRRRATNDARDRGSVLRLVHKLVFRDPPRQASPRNK